MMESYFRHPSNGHVVTATGGWWLLWAYLFGPLYFVHKGIWTHALIFTLVAAATAGVAWLVYPAFAARIVRRHFLERGWVSVAPAYSGGQSVTTSGT